MGGGSGGRTGGSGGGQVNISIAGIWPHYQKPAFSSRLSIFL
jgi:hypothetical protein